MEGGGNILLDDQARVAVTALTILSTFISPTQANITFDLWQRSASYDGWNPGAGSIFVASIIECALQCAKSESNTMFVYTRSQQSCDCSELRVYMNGVYGTSSSMFTRKSGCPSNYTYASSIGCCFNISTYIRTYAKALHECETVDQGRLLYIDDWDTHDFFARYLTENDIFHNYTYLIDGSDDAAEGVWRHTDGTTLPYLSFARGDPQHHDRDNQDCLVLDYHKYFYFNDAPCASEFRFICEIRL